MKKMSISAFHLCVLASLSVEALGQTRAEFYHKEDESVLALRASTKKNLRDPTMALLRKGADQQTVKKLWQGADDYEKSLDEAFMKGDFFFEEHKSYDQLVVFIQAFPDKDRISWELAVCESLNRIVGTEIAKPAFKIDPRIMNPTDFGKPVLHFEWCDTIACKSRRSVQKIDTFRVHLFDPQVTVQGLYNRWPLGTIRPPKGAVWGMLTLLYPHHLDFGHSLFSESSFRTKEYFAELLAQSLKEQNLLGEKPSKGSPP